MKPGQNRDSIAGFTLFEALVAMALMGMILAALATVTAQWLPNWNRGIIRVQLYEKIALALDRVSADVGAAEYVPANRLVKRPFFEGLERSITFVRTALGPNTGTGLEIIRIAEVSSEQGPILVRMQAPFAPISLENQGRDQWALAHPVVLLRAPHLLSFSYAGTDRVWRATWQNEIYLPKAVRLTIRDAGTSRILSVSTAHIIHTQVPSECIAAKSYDQCRSSQLQSVPDSGKPVNTD